MMKNLAPLALKTIKKQHRHSSNGKFLPLSLALLLATPLSAMAGNEHSHDHADEHTHDQVYQTPEQTVYEDAKILAEQSGLLVADVEKSIAFQTKFSELAQKINERFPDKVSGIWVEAVPKTQGHMRFKGKIPEEVRALLTENRLSDKVSIRGNDKLSLGEQLKRVNIMAKSLLSMGYKNAITSFNQKTQMIDSTVQVSALGVKPDKRAIVTRMHKQLQLQKSKTQQEDGQVMDAKALEFSEQEFNLKVVRGEGPMIDFEHSRGGNWLRDDGFRECTSGWAVSGGSGDGIITAAHCTGLNQFEEPGVPLYSMTWRRQHLGPSGDTEYHTTTHIEPAEFYATAGSIREVNAWRWTWSMPGAAVCRYGRSSNIRTCNHTVLNIGVTVNQNGTLVGSMVTASNHSGIGGDSGGGWSWGNTAWGIHSGSIWNGTTSVFTPIFEGMTSVGTFIKTQ
ncbi:hypothetical protein SG34_014115 [Thalassomonas viridans]|uniref:Peptidase S1 domain-containing protein n=1 Tax=Thalassomonas viridans TaxID=137584 RepID=A0AAE9Z700_9GAMM|nr:hypothetical protein [Thalassomonas viridans]WDE07916.1 hypothetical protein SG34_014115 [Thalassomonas viridans]